MGPAVSGRGIEAGQVTARYQPRDPEPSTRVYSPLHAYYVTMLTVNIYRTVSPPVVTQYRK